MDFNDDPHLDVCQNIEAGLKEAYECHADLTDTMCMFALENAKTAVKKKFGFAKNESVTTHPQAREIIDWCVSVAEQRIGKVNNLTLREYLARVDKVKRSVKLHSDFGTRGYYEFIRDFV